MDVSAFEADTGEPLTWSEALERLPEGVRVPIRHGARICKGFGGVVLFIVALAGCVVAFCLMIVWIGLYWALTQLLFKTSTLLCMVYEEPNALALSPEAKEELQAEGGKTEGHAPSERASTVGHQPNAASITGSGLNTSKPYLHSVKPPHQRRDTSLAGPSHLEIPASAAPSSREEALKRILQQEKELDAKIEAFSVDPPGHEHETGTSSTFDAARPQFSRRASVTSHRSSASNSPESMDESRESGTWPRLPSLDPDNAEDSVHSSITQRIGTVKPGLPYSTEQLMEAANFQKTATPALVRVRPPRRPAAKVPTPQPQSSEARRPSEKVNKGNAVRQPIKVPSTESQTSNEQRLLIKHEKRNAAGALDPRKPAALNFNFSTTAPESLPPHLRKLIVNNDLLVSMSQQLFGCRNKLRITENGRSTAQRQPPSKLRSLGNHKAMHNENLKTSDAERPQKVKQVGRGIPVETLKSLNPGVPRQDSLPRSFLAKIERGMRVISSKEDTCKYNPCGNPACPYQHVQGRKVMCKRETTNRFEALKEDSTEDEDEESEAESAVGSPTQRSEETPVPGHHETVLRDAQANSAQSSNRESAITKPGPPRVPILSQRPGAKQGPSSGSPERKAIVKQMANARRSQVVDCDDSTTEPVAPPRDRRYVDLVREISGNTVPSMSEPSLESGSHHLDLLGLDFSVGAAVQLPAHNTLPASVSKNPANSPAKAPTESASHTPDKRVKDVFTAFAESEKLRLRRAQEMKREVQRAEKNVKLEDLKKFAANFKVNSRMPDDLVPIITRDLDKQRELQYPAATPAPQQFQATVPSFTPSKTRFPSAAAPKVVGLASSIYAPKASISKPPFEPSARAFTPSSAHATPQRTETEQTAAPAPLPPTITPFTGEIQHYGGHTASQYMFGDTNGSQNFYDHTFPTVTAVASSYSFPAPSYGPAYQNSFANDWNAALFQDQLSSIHQPISHNIAHIGSSLHFPTAQRPREFVPAIASKPQTRSHSISKAVQIVKPPEVKYDEQFPKLPNTKANGSESKIRQPPPGLQPGLGATQTTFDALLSKRPAAPNAFDALVGDGARVATSNLFDALLNSSNEVQVEAPSASDGDPSEGTDEAAGAESGSAAKATQKKRKHARAALAKACIERETIRKRVLGTDTLDGRHALKYATKTYNDLRIELGMLMASGQLRGEDSKKFPWLSPSDLSAPNVKMREVQKLIPEDKIEISPPTVQLEQREKTENKAPKKTEDEIKELTTKAINARNMYAEAHAVFNRPPPQGRPNLKEMRLQAEQRIERAAKNYATRRAELTAAYGGALPADVKEKLWTYNDASLKKDRDTWFK